MQLHSPGTSRTASPFDLPRPGRCGQERGRVQKPASPHGRASSLAHWQDSRRSADRLGGRLVQGAPEKWERLAFFSQVADVTGARVDPKQGPCERERERQRENKTFTVSVVAYLCNLRAVVTRTCREAV